MCFSTSLGQSQHHDTSFFRTPMHTLWMLALITPFIHIWLPPFLIIFYSSIQIPSISLNFRLFAASLLLSFHFTTWNFALLSHHFLSSFSQIHALSLQFCSLIPDFWLSTVLQFHSVFTQLALNSSSILAFPLSRTCNHSSALACSTCVLLIRSCISPLVIPIRSCISPHQNLHFLQISGSCLFIHVSS